MLPQNKHTLCSEAIHIIINLILLTNTLLMLMNNYKNKRSNFQSQMNRVLQLSTIIVNGKSICNESRRVINETDIRIV